jgi:hypothetical protein
MKAKNPFRQTYKTFRYLWWWNLWLRRNRRRWRRNFRRPVKPFAW